MNRVSDLAGQNLTLAHMRLTQGRIMDAQLQIATGKSAQRYAGIAQESGRVVTLKADHTRASQFIANNKNVDLRLQKMEASVAGVNEIAAKAKTLLVNATNAKNLKDLALAGEAKNMLDEVAGFLNERLDGRYLFSGSRTDTAPVDLAGLPKDGAFVGTADAYYYRGDAQTLTVRASESLEIDYGVNADAPGFERLIRALQIVRTTDTSDLEAARKRLDGALALVNEAVTELPDIRGGIGGSRNAIGAATAQHDEFLLYAEQAIGDIENVDVTKAITSLSADQATLEASLATIARMSSLSLVDYLR